MIHLETVTPENWRLELTVKDDQRHFVSDSVGILARAYAYRDNRSRAFVIYNNDQPVGMAMYYDIEDEKKYNFSQFFIDQRYQRNGFGYDAAKLILQMMKYKMIYIIKLNLHILLSKKIMKKKNLLLLLKFWI